MPLTSHLIDETARPTETKAETVTVSATDTLQREIPRTIRNTWEHDLLSDVATHLPVNRLRHTEDPKVLLLRTTAKQRYGSLLRRPHELEARLRVAGDQIDRLVVLDQPTQVASAITQLSTTNATHTREDLGAKHLEGSIEDVLTQEQIQRILRHIGTEIHRSSALAPTILLPNVAATARKWCNAPEITHIRKAWHRMCASVMERNKFRSLATLGKETENLNSSGHAHCCSTATNRQWHSDNLPAFA